MGKKITSRLQALIIILILLGIAFFLNYLSSKNFVRLDLTEDKEYTLSESSQAILKKLDDQIIIKLYFTDQIPAHLKNLHQELFDLLEEYRSYSSGKIQIEKIVPEASPENEQETQSLGIPPLQLNVVQKDKAEVLKVYLGVALFYADKKEVIPVISDIKNFEYDITSRLLKLTSKKVPQLGLITHSMDENQGDSYKLLEKILREQFQIEKLSFESENIAERPLDALLVIAPRSVPESFQEELNKIIEKNIPLVVFLDAVDVDGNLQAHVNLSGLESWLSQFSLSLVPELLIEPKYPGRAAFSSGFVQYQIPYPFFAKVPKEGLNQNNPITAQLEELTFAWANTFSMTSQDSEKWKMTSLAKSSEASFLQEGDPVVFPQALEQMPFQPGETRDIAIFLEEKVSENENPSRVLLVANDDFAKDRFLGDFASNLIFIQNMVDWMSWGEDLIDIRSRGKTSRPLPSLEPQTMSLIRWSHVLGLPFLVILSGVVVFFIRRKKHQSLRNYV